MTKSKRPRRSEITMESFLKFVLNSCWVVAASLMAEKTNVGMSVCIAFVSIRTEVTTSALCHF